MTRRLALLVLVLSSPLSAATPHGFEPYRTTPEAVPPATYGPWRSARIGGGGYVTGIALCPSASERLYAWSDVAGVFRSDDGGRHWRMAASHGDIPLTSVRSLVVHPDDADDLVIAVGTQWAETQGIYRSRDGGSSWSLVQRCQFFGNGPLRAAGSVLQRDPEDPQRLVAASSFDGVYRSVDGGTTWTASGGAAGLAVADLDIDRGDPQRLWLCARPQRLWVRRDGESSQHQLAGGHYLSTDGGTNWRRVADDAPDEMVQDPLDPKRWYALFDAREVRRSLDGGRSWTTWSEGLPQAQGDKRPPASHAHGYQAIGVGPDFVAVVSGNATAFRRGLDSATWEAVPITSVVHGDWFGGRSGYRRFARATATVVVDPRDPAHWLLSDWYAVHQSWDAGDTWLTTIDGIENTVIHTLVQDPDEPALVHLGMADNGYFRSADGGVSFAWVEDAPNNCKTIVATPGGRLSATGPLGHDWHANQLYVSTDRGASWLRSPMTGIGGLDEERCNSIAVDPRDPHHLLLARSGPVGPDAGGVYHSRDGGRSWNWDGTGLPDGRALFHHQIWVVGHEVAIAGSGAAVAISRDTGEAWHRPAGEVRWRPAQLTAEGRPNHVVADPHHPHRLWLAATGSGLHRSDDGGATWERVFERGLVSVACDRHQPDRLAACPADGAGVALSEDAGVSWRILGEELPHRADRAAFAGERLVVASGGCGVFWMPLTPAGERPLHARPERLEAQTWRALDLLDNPSFERPGEAGRPAGWGAPWIGQGAGELRRVTSTAVHGDAAMVVETSAADSHLVLAQTFPEQDGVLAFSGRFRLSAGIDECQIAVRAWDADWQQLDWQTLVTAHGESDDWRGFRREITLHRGAAHHQLTLVIKGRGTATFDDLRVEHRPGPWPAVEAPR